MRAAALRAEMETAGIRVFRDGASLRVEVLSDVTLDPYRQRVRESKPTLLAVLQLQEQIVEAATVAQSAFDRAAYDRLWAEWHAVQSEEIPS
jgi:fumarylacetoacetate (FAA) hydrolase family protein